MKKSTLLAIIALVMALAMGITGTMAYLQDTDEDVNVMTLGNVYIDQIELERDEDGNLQQFTQAKPLFPAVYDDASAWQPVWPSDDPNSIHWAASDVNGLIDGIPSGAWNGMWDAEQITNTLDKFVFVKNTGKSDAYVRTIYAFEAETIEFDDPEGFGLIHCNWNGNALFDYAQEEGRQAGYENDIYIEGVEIDGVLYNLVVVTYQSTVAPGEVIRPSLLQVGMGKAADNEHVAQFGETYDILVVSQAVQAAGFDSAQEALEAAFGVISADNHPWVNGAAVPVMVDNIADLRAALEAGETDIVVKGAAITENPFNGHYYKDRNVDFVDCTITANMNYMYINDASFTNCTFDSGVANAAVHYDELFGDLVFNSCTFKSGKVQIGTNKNGTSTVTFNNCEFAQTTQDHSIWTEMGIRVYSPATFNNCEFNNRVVMAGSNGQSLTFDGCTMNGGTPVYYVDNTDGIIRGGNIPAVTIK